MSKNGVVRPRKSRGKHVPMSYERMAILIAVSAGPIDKSEIYDTIVGDTLGAIAIKKSSLYLLIKELLTNGYLQESGPCSLTDKGRLAVRNELPRVNQQSYILKIRLHI